MKNMKEREKINETKIVYGLIIQLLSELEKNKNEISLEEYEWTYDKLMELKSKCIIN